MKTKKLFAVLVFDNTCNVMGKDFGIYGKGDYSWITDSLNGGNGGDYSMTEEEANEVKADFEQVIRERNLEWASVYVDFVELPIAETMQDIADFYNESNVIDDRTLDSMIEANGWASDIGTEDDICHSDTEKVVINENGEAIVVSI